MTEPININRFTAMFLFLAGVFPFLVGADAYAQEANAIEESTLLVGRSVEGRPIEGYRLGTGEHDVIIIGGIHGGYEWNAIVLARRLRDLIHRRDPAAVVFFQSAAGSLWYSGAPQQWVPALRLARAYSEASGYLYEQRIPTITVELTTHHTIELDRNIAGLDALFDRIEGP